MCCCMGAEYEGNRKALVSTGEVSNEERATVMKINHVCRSGNDCDIHIPDRIRAGKYNEVRVRWEHYPPSEEDIDEYEQEVYLQQVRPILDAMVQRSHGPGHSVEIMP